MRLNHVATSEEANSGGGFAPWRAGDYDFEVHDACEEQSKSSGRDQIKLTLYVFDSDGNKRTVFDYLGADEKSAWKVRHFCEAIGLLAHYERGELDVNDIVDKAGRLRLRVKPAQGDYAAGNTVGDYIPRDGQPEKAVAPRQAAARAAPATRPQRAPVPAGAPSWDLDDSIPF